MDSLHDRSEAAMRAAIASLPQGVFEGEDFLDDDGPGGAPAAIRVRITVEGEQKVFLFTERNPLGPAGDPRTMKVSALSVAAPTL